MLPLSEKNLEGASPDAPKFSAVREHCPPEKPFATCYSPFAIRCLFGSARASPSQTFAVDEGVQPLSNLLSSSDLVRAMMMG
jgi:hypothetical protein